MNYGKREARLIREAAEEVGISFDKGVEILEYFKKSFKESVSTGKTVRIPALGIFYPSPKKMKDQFFRTLITEETIVEERKQIKEYYKNKHGK